MRGALIKRAILTGARFEEALFGQTSLLGLDLSTVSGLSTSAHGGSTIIDIEKLELSRGTIPEQFLRGCGLSDEAISFATARGGSVHFYSCFLSYSDADRTLASKLYNDLQSSGVRCWFAPLDMRIGAKIRIAIDEAIHLHEKLLLIRSEHSIRSQWVEQEVEKALEKERSEGRLVLFPIRIDDSVFYAKGGWATLVRNTRHLGDFTKWKEPCEYDSALDKLLRSLQVYGNEVPDRSCGY